ncbi:hypothetical protein [Streptomyces sp. IBSBF 2390]|uniref:hypothetical protein n=1 Tax=Streptomyces sp. IBSBF 2390 TaxID=2903533 RepID=UPI002FDC5E82
MAGRHDDRSAQHESVVSFLLLAPSVLRTFVGRQVGVGDYFFLARVVTAIAMTGGGLGTSLEGDHNVSDVACGRRQRERQRTRRQVSRPERGRTQGGRTPPTGDAWAAARASQGDDVEVDQIEQRPQGRAGAPGR